MEGGRLKGGRLIEVLLYKASKKIMEIRSGGGSFALEIQTGGGGGV